jgi:hypothetical protein
LVLINPAKRAGIPIFRNLRFSTFQNAKLSSLNSPDLLTYSHIEQNKYNTVTSASLVVGLRETTASALLDLHRCTAVAVMQQK